MSHKIIALFFILFSTSVYAQESITVIPKPAEIILDTAHFKLPNTMQILVKDDTFTNDAKLFAVNIHKIYGLVFTVNSAQGVIPSEVIVVKRNASLPHDGYKLIVTTDKIVINGNGAGVYYAFQTLKQMINKGVGNSYNITCCTITDYPQYAWRGMHLDVSRHFFPKDSIEKFIDAMALHKMNVFHWHLTDDQGWRIEIKKYPKLTSVGAYRKETIIGKNFDPYKGDSKPYGGYYTQEDIKEVVEYAAERHVTIVPEIEMPGHSQAALAAYPQYSCTGGPFQVMTTWGVSDDVFCPKEETFTFLENVLTEVMQLFPGKYIHIGGDEVPKSHWHNSAFCQKLMKSKGLKNEEELQSYFIRRIDSFITASGRSTIGWDEILEGGLASNAAIMSWRGVDGGIAAARLKHNVVMCPGEYCYFDHYQGSPKTEPLAFGGYTTTEKVYSYNPMPDSLTEEQKKYVLGAQGNIWTEYIPTFAQVQYMALPRMCALSEVLWSPLKTRDYADFKKRLFHHFNLLQKEHYNYSIALYDITGNIKSDKAINGLKIELHSDLSAGKIFYTTDNTEPTAHSYIYTTPIEMNRNATVKAAYFENGEQKSHTWVQDFHINKATGKDITLQEPPSPSYNTGGANTLVDGIEGIMPWYSKEWLGWEGKDCTAIIDLERAKYVSKVTVGTLNDDASWIHAPKTIEVYTSDDGTYFTLAKKLEQEDINKVPCRHVLTLDKPTPARYVKVVIQNSGKIPAGHPGAGENAWLFVDEIGVE